MAETVKKDCKHLVNAMVYYIYNPRASAAPSDWHNIGAAAQGIVVDEDPAPFRQTSACA